jgi:hypothetical protein
MQSKLMNLYSNYNPQIHTNLIEDVKLLIFYSDKKCVNIDTFLPASIQVFLNVKLVNKIYFELLSSYGDEVTKETKEIILKFLLENKENSDLKKKDFFKLEESDNYILFKGLLDLKYFENNEYKSTEYVKNTIEILNEIGKDITTGEIDYTEISIFYNMDKPELQSKLFEMLKKIALNDTEKATNYKNKIDNDYKTVKKVNDDLQLIVDDLLKFYEVKESKNIEEIKNIISEIKKSKLNCYEKKYVEKYKSFINQYKKKAEERLLKQKSSFYLKIYEDKKQKIKDEDFLIRETEKAFGDLKEIFTGNVNTLSKNNLNICLNAIKGKSPDEIDKEIETLVNIFNINNYNKEQIRKSMIILSKKEDIYKISLAISIFLEKIGSKGKLFDKLKEIINNLEKSNEEKVIVKAIDDLKTFKINIDIIYDEDNQNYLNILLKLKEQPEAITFLLKKTIDDCRSIQELVGEIDNAFINANDILDLEKCVDFINKLGSEQELKKAKDIDIIESFKNELEKHKDKDIQICFTRFVNNYSEIKSLVDYGLDKSEASKKKIELICEKSEFILSNIKEAFFKAKYYEKITDKEDKKEKVIAQELTFDNLLELRDRVQLTKKVTGDEKELQILENNRQFIEKVSEIYNIYDLLEDIYMSGYPEKIEVTIKINKLESTYIGCKLNTNHYLQIINHLKQILTDLKKSQLKAYKSKPLIRFIYGRQFNLIYDILTKKMK